LSTPAREERRDTLGGIAMPTFSPLSRSTTIRPASPLPSTIGPRLLPWIIERRTGFVRGGYFVAAGKLRWTSR